VAQANDRLEPKQMISASGTIVLVFSVFAALGPFTMSYFLESLKCLVLCSIWALFT